MKIIKKEEVNKIIKKAKTKNGVILVLELEGEKEKYEVSLKIRRYQKGSYVLCFGLENNYLNKFSKSMADTFSTIFRDISFKKEFKINFIWGDGYFKTWAYLGDEEDVIKHFFQIQYNFRKWKITNIIF
jgi:hypothetical protein